ncbi:MAG: hypothetical protein QNJ85_04050 [Gammaproteobacteria bacterium]|nr:hypothetical protein [Gammaproteobacteria bacterium]
MREDDYFLYHVWGSGELDIYQSVEEIADSVELLDVTGGLHLFIDNCGYLYAVDSTVQAGLYGYTLRKTGDTWPAALSIIKKYSNHQILTSDDMKALGIETLDHPPRPAMSLATKIFSISSLLVILILLLLNL